MVSGYVEGWRQKCLITDARLVALDVSRWFKRPKIVMLYPSPSASNMMQEAMEEMQKSLLVPREYLNAPYYSGTTAIVSSLK